MESRLTNLIHLASCAPTPNFVDEKIEAEIERTAPLSLSMAELTRSPHLAFSRPVYFSIHLGMKFFLRILRIKKLSFPATFLKPF